MLSVYPTFVLGLSVCLSVCHSFIVLLLEEGKGREAGIHCHHPEAELSAVFTVAAVQVQRKRARCWGESFTNLPEPLPRRG